MKVYQQFSDRFGIGIRRVVHAIKEWSPLGIEFVDTRDEADLVIHHIIGVGNFDTVPINDQIKQDVDAGRRYAMLQYCFRTTEIPHVSFWGPLWKNAAAVWSYYNLEGLTGSTIGKPFYYAPLGVMPAFRHEPRAQKLFLFGTSGHIAETEGTAEVAAMLEGTPHYHFHLGPNHLNLGPRVAYGEKLTDRMVSDRWNECVFVSGMRRVEGFELPAAEAAVVGSIPVLFDTPDYRQWFEGLGAEFIREGTSYEVVEALFDMVQDRRQEGTLALTEDQRKLAKARFDWPTHVTNFWEVARG